MALPEYKNLTSSELEMADHCAEIGDTAALRRYQKLSADRDGKPVNEQRYFNPMPLYKDKD